MAKANAKLKLYNLHPNLEPYFYGIDNNGGGDCLFYSLGMAKDNNNTFNKAMQIRREVYNYQYNRMEDNIAPIDDISLAGIRMGSKNEERDGKLMNQQGVYGTDYEIIKAAKLYNVPIIVYQNRDTSIYNMQCPTNRGGLYDMIRAGTRFRGVTRYLNLEAAMPNLVCVYLPNRNTDSEPLIIYNIDNYHYIMLRPIENGLPNLDIVEEEQQIALQIPGITKENYDMILKQQEQLLASFKKPISPPKLQKSISDELKQQHNILEQEQLFASFKPKQILEESKTWDCSQCTLQNPADKEKCEVCEAKKPVQPLIANLAKLSDMIKKQPVQPSISNLAKLSNVIPKLPAQPSISNLAKLSNVIPKQLPNTWKCPACTFENKLSNQNCEMCGTLNPQLPKKKIKLDDLPIPEGKDQPFVNRWIDNYQNNSKFKGKKFNVGQMKRLVKWIEENPDKLETIDQYIDF